MPNLEVKNERIICAWCGSSSHLEWVHGRGQCSVCKVILDGDYRWDGIDSAIKPREESPKPDNYFLYPGKIYCRVY